MVKNHFDALDKCMEGEENDTEPIKNFLKCRNMS